MALQRMWSQPPPVVSKYLISEHFSGGTAGDEVGDVLLTGPGGGKVGCSPAALKSKHKDTGSAAQPPPCVLS